MRPKVLQNFGLEKGDKLTILIESYRVVWII